MIPRSRVFITKKIEGWGIVDKLTAVPTARVARKARSPTFSTGLQLVGGSAPKPLAYPLHNLMVYIPVYVRFSQLYYYDPESNV